MLDRHCALIATSLLALGAGCGDDACPGPSTDHTCRVERVDGLTVGGELGFRFGDALDVDGDGLLDIVAGSRRGGSLGYGEAGLWSRGALLLHWESDEVDALFGHVSLAVPDLDGDHTPDIIISAPSAIVDGRVGHVEAFSGRDGTRLWRTLGPAYDGLGWHVTRTSDLDGDGVADLLVGAPSDPAQGHVYVLSGRTGDILRSITGPGDSSQFGFYLTATGDLDRDGLPDIAIGAPTEVVGGKRRGAVHFVSSATGAELRVLAGEIEGHQFGEMLVGLDDVDRDGVDDIAIGAVGDPLHVSSIAGEVSIVSGATGERLHLLPQGEADELYGRMLAAVPDVDGDGRRDLAIGAPWWNGRNGRVEIRSTANFATLAEIRGSETGWLGWHIASAGADGLLVSQLHAQLDTGAVELHELR